MGIFLGGVGLGERGENVGSNILEGKVELAAREGGAIFTDRRSSRLGYSGCFHSL